MAKIILACNKKPFTAFLESVLTNFQVEIEMVDDRPGLIAKLKEFAADLLLLDSEFSLSDESAEAELLQELKTTWPRLSILSLCDPSPVELDALEALDTIAEDTLPLPFNETELIEKIKQVSGLELVKVDFEDELNDENSFAIETTSSKKEGFEQNQEAEKVELEIADELSEAFVEEGNEMEKSDVAEVVTLELTEIVEEGLPLDDLPEVGISQAESVATLQNDSAATEASAVIDEETSGDDFGDDLDELTAYLETSTEDGAPEPAAELSGDSLDALSQDSIVEPGQELDLESDVEDLDLASEFDLEPGEDSLAGEKTEVQGSEIKVEDDKLDSADANLDALLDDDDFVETEMTDIAANSDPINDDPVLAELKNAGLKPENETLETQNDLSDVPILEESVADTLAGDGQDLLKEDSGEDVLTEFVEMPRPEEVAMPESDESSESFSEASFSEVDENVQDENVQMEPESDPKPESDGLKELTQPSAPELELEPELPEDYIVDDELLDEDSDLEAGIEPEPEPEPELEVEVKPETGEIPPVTPAPIQPVSGSSEPQVLTEPQTPDFSRQIEDMTQEWSKQLLQTTYASMDKMIKAIGDLAPTIVDQVAREVIPPLAEKVIKAEIARLEAKLEQEEKESGN